MSKNSQITLPFITGAANVGLGVCINEVSEQVLDDWNPPTLLVIGIAVLFGVLPFVANAVSERSEEETRTRWVWVAGLSITGFAVASLWMLNQWTVLPDKVTEFLGYATVGLFVFGVLFPPMALLLLALRKGEPVIQAMGTEAIASADSLQQWRENMRTVMNLEVKQWLDNALHDKKKHDRKNGQHQKNSILLKMEDRREQVGQEAKLEIQTPEPVWPLRLRRLWQPFRGQEQQVLDLQERILDIFHKPEIGGRLLILGKPGAGKTTTLLELARDLLEEAQGHTEGQKQPIPVLFEMFRYPGKITIGQWLVEDLQKRHSIPPAHTEAALQRGDLLPLIDGLDEVGLNRQQDCIAQMNRFLREGVPYASRLSLVVCCRQQQYREGEVMLEALNGAVYLQALEDDQIQRYLRGLGRGELWRQIQRDEGLLELARIPLFLHLIPVAYPQGIESQGTGGQQTQAALLEKYVERKLDEPNAKGARKYTPEQTRRYLTWLARSLKQQRQTDSYIEEMQPILLATKGERLVYRLIVGMIEGMFLGVMVGMILEGFEGLFFKLIGGLIGGLIDGVIFGTVGLSIELTEAFDFSQKKIKKGIIYWLVLALILGVFFDAIFGIIFGGIVGLIRGLRADLNYRSKANQGILESAKNAITVFLITLPATMLIFILPEFVTGRSVDFTNTLISGLGLSAILSFSFGGGLACIQHLVLRVMLCQKEVIAWNYSQFLTYAAERRLLNQVGGRYRFLHDKLREHFAGDARTPGSR